MGWTLFVAVALAIGHLLIGRVRSLGSSDDSKTAVNVRSPGVPVHERRLRIVVPCRNEAASIANLLSSLGPAAGWEAGLTEIIVVDDGSTDDTVLIAERFDGVQVVRAPTLPDGWCGKPWACTVGVEFGQPLLDEDILVFLDADVTVAGDALVQLLETRNSRGGVVSVQPFHTVPTAVEQLSAVFNLVSMMGIGAATEEPVGMFGPVVCCRVADYRAAGGHSAVRGEVVEDMALARRFRETGTRVTVRAGGALLRFRMYPTGLRSLVEGWTKNMSTGAGATPVVRRLGVALWVAALLVASTLPFRGDSALLTALGVMAYLATAVSTHTMLRPFGSYRWWISAAFPLAIGFFCVVFFRSVWCTTVRHSVHWRDRVIHVGIRGA